MPFCFRWRISPFGAASSDVCASVPGSPAGGRVGACLPLDLVVRCSSACGAKFRVLASWGPLLVPCSLYSPATEILSFFLGSFEVVFEGFLPPTAGRSLIGGTSACSGPLRWVTATSLAFGLATAVFCYCGWFTRGYGWSPVLPPPLREWRTAPSRVPSMPCASTGIYFRAILASSRLSFEWWFRRACAGLLLPRPLGACRSPLRLFTGWFLLSVVVSSWQNLAWLFSWRLWLGAGSFLCLVIGTVVPVVPLLFWAILRSTGGDGLHSSESIRLKDVPFFFFCSPGLGLRGLAFAVLACFPPGWNGGFHLWRFPGESLGRGRTFFGRWVLPDSRALGAGLPGLSGSWSLELLPLSRLGCVQLPLPLLFITPFASLVFPSENFGVMGVDGVFGSWFWAGVHLWVVLPARCRSSASSPNLMASWRGGSGAWLAFFLFSFFPFSFGDVVTPRMLEWELDWDFPSGCSSFSLGVASAPAVAGNGCRVLQARPFFGTVDLSLFETLLFLPYATRCRYDVPGVLASGSGLAASARGYACGRCLRITLSPGPGFPVVSLPFGRVVWWICGWCSFPLTWTDVSHSLRSWWGQSLLRCLSLRVGFSCSSGPDGGLLSDPVAPFLEETIEVPMRVGSSSSLSGLSTVDFFPVFPRVFSPGVSWLPLTGFYFAGLVDWLILVPRSWNPPSQSAPFSRFVTFWRLCDASWSPHLFPRSLRRFLSSCLAALPLPHYRWSRVHGRSSAGLIWWVSALWATVSWWYRASWLAQGYVPLLRPFDLLLALWSGAPSGSLLWYRSESSQWVHPSGSSQSQSSIGTKALPSPSWCLVGAFAMRSPLRVEYFSDLDRNEDSSRTFPRVWCRAFVMGSPVSGRVAYCCTLDQNEGLFHP